MIERYKKSTELDPNDADAWINLGDAYYDENKYEYAIESYEKAIEINPYFSEVWNNLGLALSMMRQYREAIKCYLYSTRLADSWIPSRISMNSSKK